MHVLARALMLVAVMLSAVAHGTAQAFAQQSSAATATGTITGRVTIAGKPAASMPIYLTPDPRTGRRERLGITGTTDADGQFQLTHVPAGRFNVAAFAPAFYSEGEGSGYEGGKAITLAEGESVDGINIALRRGGVITGRITDATGHPMIQERLNLYRINPQDGKHEFYGRNYNGMRTGDRGVYRLYGLSSGTYVVVASGKHPYFNQGNGYENDVPTYYPSSTRDTAQPITVQAGEEVSGIDIHYRGERGHAISGKIFGFAAGSTNVTFNLRLYNAATRTVEGEAYVVSFYPGNNEGIFAFYGVADGEYIISAVLNRYDSKLASGTGRARVKIKGADATGIDITLMPQGSIAGRLVIEPLRNPDGQDKCEIKRRLTSEEMLIKARREEKTGEPDLNFTSIQQNAPSDAGEFLLNWLEAGQYHVEPAMLGEDYFVQSITLPAPAKNQPPTDAARTPLTVHSGERLNNLTVTVAEGAAAVRGRITPAKAGAPLPNRLRIHMVPAEKATANEGLRYYEAEVRGDSFELQNLAPGRYFVIARRAADDSASEESPLPVARDAVARQRLRQRAEAANTVLELRPCQRRTDYVFKYTPQRSRKRMAICRKPPPCLLDPGRGAKLISCRPDFMFEGVRIE